MNILNFDLKERNIIIGICIIFSLRVIGMFIVLPVFSTYGIFLKDSTTFLVGVAVGIYGLFQAIFQIPYGWLSDKIGRKFVIILGLLFFFIGSCICFLSNSIFGIILGRSLQGSGAISSVCMALLSDVISKKNRTKAMGLLGISFGISFIISVVISPIIVQIFGFRYLFLVGILLSIICIIIVFFVIPSFVSFTEKFYLKDEFKNFIYICKNFKLFQLNLNIFFLHMILVLYFFFIPLQLRFYTYFSHISWIVYFITIVISFVIASPISSYFNKNENKKLVILLSICGLMLSNCMLLLFEKNSFFLIFAIQTFFVVFSFFEMILPILVSENAPIRYKGTSMAVYSISQFLGSSIGSVLGGFFLNNFNSYFLLFITLILNCIWFFVNFLCLKM
ncbi:hypothetical protein XW81_02120 [Buchnera aphidicola (Schlechtendalia chinensis)]|uniref:Major facilitator superfamily (MFS) profile domain-containing protein n=1 Tax=Buchnera aphidicola subsp. Schlechtendalia chinensis TaxID=118110 RepID=A0A172WDX4_BUCSC|nr:MFS transporter [Buchnera aphidicola]ANF17178.1 hypothetical protein XW81_02120 [Buchnera aphidicola (Schlechtendalia chinensis)]